jgi:cytochrome c5
LHDGHGISTEQATFQLAAVDFSRACAQRGVARGRNYRGVAIASCSSAPEKAARVVNLTLRTTAAGEFAAAEPDGSDVTQTQCQLCHSTDYIVMQPPGDAKQWEGVVNHLRSSARRSVRPTRRSSRSTWPVPMVRLVSQSRGSRYRAWPSRHGSPCRFSPRALRIRPRVI